jgi:hypothetical protein
MKKLFGLLLLFPLFAAAQDCTLKKDTDPFTHAAKLSTGFVPFNTADGVQLSVSMDAAAKEIDLFFWIKNPGTCFNDASTAVINFEGDRVKVNLRNGGSMNCQGAFHMLFKNAADTPYSLERLTKKKIVSIQFKGDKDKLTTANFNDEQRQRLTDMLLCTIKEAKTLVK